MTSEADGLMPSRRLELVADQADELAAALADGARAQYADGDLLASRQSFERAYRLAEQAADVQAMAAAALGLAYAGNPLVASLVFSAPAAEVLSKDERRSRRVGSSTTSTPCSSACWRCPSIRPGSSHPGRRRPRSPSR